MRHHVTCKNSEKLNACEKIAVKHYLFDLCLIIIPFISGESRKGVLGSRGPPAATGQPGPTGGVSDCSITTKKIH